MLCHHTAYFRTIIMHSNKKPRTEDGRPVAATGTAPPSPASVAPAPKPGEVNDVNLGDSRDWNAMDHLSRLKYLRPLVVVQKGCPTKPDITFLHQFPKAVFNPLSATRKTEIVHASECAMTDVFAYFKSAKLDDEEDKKTTEGAGR